MLSISITAMLVKRMSEELAEVKNQILFIHSAKNPLEFHGSNGLINYLRRKLGQSYEILTPDMPTPDDAKYEDWSAIVNECLCKLGERPILVGHSLGGSVLMKFLSEHLVKKEIAGLFTIAAPFWSEHKGWQLDGYILPKDFSSALSHISRIFIYHSHDDTVVPFDHALHYAEYLTHAKLRPLKGRKHSFREGFADIIADIRNLSSSATETSE